jgi:hypothetical protein
MPPGETKKESEHLLSAYGREPPFGGGTSIDFTKCCLIDANIEAFLSTTLYIYLQASKNYHQVNLWQRR